MSANDSQGIGTRVCSLIENVFASSVDSGFATRNSRGTFRQKFVRQTFESGIPQLSRKKRAFFRRYQPTHSGDTATAREKAVARGSRLTRGGAWAPHRTGEKQRRSRWARCVVLEPNPLRDTPARGRTGRARATSRSSRFRFVTLPRWRCSPRANLARGLSLSASLRATLTRLPAFRHDLSSTPDCPRSCGGSPRCAPARTSSRASATNPRAARRRTRESSPTSSRATPGKPCVRRASEDAMSCRCVSDFDAISREDI